MKLGLVIYGSLAQQSGGYLYDRRLVEALRAAGDQVELISLGPRRYGPSMLDNLAGSLRRRLAEAGFDLLLQDELAHPSLFWLNRGLARSGAPILAIVHHLRSQEPRARLLNRFFRRIERAYLGTVAGAVYSSRATRATVQALVGDGLAGVVVHPGREPLHGRIDPGRIAARAVEPGPLRIVFLGNLLPRKGLHTLLAALNRLPPDRARLTVIGSSKLDPAYGARIRRRIERMDGRVRLLGSLPHPAIQDRLLDAQLLVMPSGYEGFGIAYLEGMGCGLPAIAGSAGGAGELVQEGQNGYLVPPGNAALLAERIALLADDRQLLSALGQAALQTFAAHPTWEQATARVRAFLERTATGRHSSRR